MTHEPTHTGNINIKTWEEGEEGGESSGGRRERKKRRKRTREWEGEEAKGSGVEEEEPVLSKL